MRKNLFVDSLGDGGGGGDYQPTKLVISEFSSALKVGFPSKDFICDWKSYRVRQGKRKTVCKCVAVGSLSLIKIPVEIGRKSASFGPVNARTVYGEKIREKRFSDLSRS